jgi:hypothetical protein
LAVSTGTAWGTSVLPGTAGNVLTSNGTTWTSTAPPPSGPTLTAIASGTLADGSRVIINAGGTVSTAGIAPANVGADSVFNSASTNSTISAIYDSASQRVIIAYSNAGNTNRGTCVVGTVSGSNISFGTPVIFANLNTDFIAATYNSVAQRIVIAYTNASSGAGSAIVGTVSGNSISFGTAVLFNSASTDQTSVTYDSVADRVIIAYRNIGNSSFGTAIVGTVSGTAISFGTPFVFNSGNTFSTSAIYHTAAQRLVIAYSNAGSSSVGTAFVGTVSGSSISFGSGSVFNNAATLSISATYDSIAQRVIIAYSNFGNSQRGTAIVGTVSGSNISFGTAVLFNNTTTDSIAATYNAAAQQTVITYRNVGGSNFGTAIAGTVSGTTISFGTPVVFNSADTNGTAAAYDSVAQRVVIAYVNVGNSNFGTAKVFQNEGTNLTAQNFIGFSNAAYTNGQTATIQIAGSVDDAQSGLIPGRSYFVQNNGTLGLTPANPSVFAGTAVAANRIIVKG